MKFHLVFDIEIKNMCLGDADEAALLSSPTIELPCVYTFIDAHNQLFEIVGWDKESAASELEKDERVSKPIRWFGSYVAYPGVSGAIRQVNYDKTL